MTWLPSLSGIASKFSFIFYDRYMHTDPGMPAILLRSSLYSASLVAIFAGGYFAVQGHKKVGAGIGAFGVVSFMTARYAPLPYAKCLAAISLIALFVIPIGGMAYDFTKTKS